MKRHGTYQSNIRISLAKTIAQLDGSNFDLCVKFTLFHTLQTKTLNNTSRFCSSV
jgi:hypothetical protein